MIQLAGVLLIQNGNYVLQHRDSIPAITYPDTYSIWGGALEGSETTAEGAQRELLEETGIKATLEQLKHLCTYTIPSMYAQRLGELVEVSAYFLELHSETVVACFEGQGIVKIPVGSRDPKINKYSLAVLEAYEQQKPKS